jgi:hypothetical protein
MKLKVFIAESVSPKEFYNRDREGLVVEEIVRLLNGKPSYRIVLNTEFLRKAIKTASRNAYNVFHLACHGNEAGIGLTTVKPTISWDELADLFQETRNMPVVLVLSSCLGGNRGISRAFATRKIRPEVIFGAEADKENVLTFPNACIAWPILYTSLAAMGNNPESFKDAVKKMNHITPHRFVYRRWVGKKYLRYPSKPS